jgi:hypothetical protein
LRAHLHGVAVVIEACRVFVIDRRRVHVFDLKGADFQPTLTREAG